MEQNTLYTAIGRLDRETNGCGRSCPVIRLGGQTYMVDMQEMVVWTALNWRISKREDISLQCDKLVSSLGDCISRSWDACVNRLLTRGLLVSGCGETEYDALYDLLSSLGIIPASGSMLMRSISFVKLVAGRRVPIQQALKLFQKDRRTDYETRVMRLAQQALLSTAEIIKCVEQDVAYRHADKQWNVILYAALGARNHIQQFPHHHNQQTDWRNQAQVAECSSSNPFVQIFCPLIAQGKHTLQHTFTSFPMCHLVVLV